MSITVKGDRTGTVHKHSRRIDFDGAEPITLGRGSYTHRGKQFIPVTASSSWNHGEQPETITAQGPILKKDGTPGQQIAQVTYATPANKYWGVDVIWVDPSAPVWMLDLFDIPVPGAVDPDEPTEEMGA